MNFSFLVLFFSLFLPSVLCRQPGDLLDGFEAFLGSLTKAWTGNISGNSSRFTDDCIGRINMIMNLHGVESNTEFLFRAPAEVAQANTTQLLGFPVNATVESLSIQQSIVAASVILSMQYSTLSMAIPLQVDMWLRFTEDVQIEAYDLSVRRFEKSFQFLRPMLTQQIENELSLPTADVDSAISRRAATDICDSATTYCEGDNVQYNSFDACTQELSNLMFDNDLDFCRYIHKDLVKFRPDVYCSALSISGGEPCAGAIVDYVNATTDYPFTASLVSANVTVPGTDGLSQETIKELTRANMLQIYPTTVPFYSIPIFVYFIILYASGKVTEQVFYRFSTVFPLLSLENRRNTITYVMNTFYTTVALILQLISSPVLAEQYTVEHIKEIRTAGLVISGLYLYEIIYRPHMRWTLQVHHFCTLFAVMFTQVVLQISLNPALVAVGIIWLFQATTEQSIFISLTLYRLRYSKSIVQPALKFAAIQSFIFKVASAMYVIIWWGLKLSGSHQPADVAYSVFLVLITVLLMATQVYGSWAVWCIALNMDRPRSKQEVDSLSADASNSASAQTFSASNLNEPPRILTEVPVTESDSLLGLNQPFRDSLLMFGNAEDSRQWRPERASYNTQIFPV